MPFLCPSQAQYQAVFSGKTDNARLCLQHPDVFAKRRDFLEEKKGTEKFGVFFLQCSFEPICFLVIIF